MKAGDVLRYASDVRPALSGVPVLCVAVEGDTATIDVATVKLSVPLADLSPARLWWRKGADDWQGPSDHWPDGAPDALRVGMSSPLGASVVLDGWRYRLAWGGDDPPERYGG